MELTAYSSYNASTCFNKVSENDMCYYNIDLQYLEQHLEQVLLYVSSPMPC